jgi:hypothetical protein
MTGHKSRTYYRNPFHPLGDYTCSQHAADYKSRTPFSAGVCYYPAELLLMHMLNLTETPCTMSALRAVLLDNRLKSAWFVSNSVFMAQ